MIKLPKRLLAIVLSTAMIVTSMNSYSSAATNITEDTSEVPTVSADADDSVTSAEAETTTTVESTTEAATTENVKNNKDVTESEPSEITDDSYQILKKDSKGRELEVKTDSGYVTYEYNDKKHTVTAFYSIEKLNGKNYYAKEVITEIKENEFHSVKVVSTEVSGVTTVEEYDKDGNVTKSIDEKGNFIIKKYKNGYMVEEINPYTGTDADALHTMKYKYDKAGNCTKKMTPKGEKDGEVYYFIEKYEYDGEQCTCYSYTVNEPGEAERYAKREFIFDKDNLVMTKESDSEGNVVAIVQNYYDKSGNCVRKYAGLTKPLIISGLDDVSSTGNDDYSITKYEYDGEYLMKETDPNGNVTSYTYDSDGLVKTMTDGKERNMNIPIEMEYIALLRKPSIKEIKVRHQMKQ